MVAYPMMTPLHTRADPHAADDPNGQIHGSIGGWADGGLHRSRTAIGPAHTASDKTESETERTSRVMGNMCAMVRGWLTVVAKLPVALS